MVAQPPTTPQNDASQSNAPTVSNREVLQQLEREREVLTAQCLLLGTGMVLGLAFWNSGVALGLAPLAILLKRLQKVSQLVLLMGVILDEFESLGVELFSRLDVPNCQPLDLFIRFPTKIFLIISIRSMGKSKIVFNEKTENLYVKRKGKGMKKWLPDPLTELSDYQAWLRKDRRDLFGGSSNDTRRPTAKVLVLWGEAEPGNHPEHWYDTVDGQKFLWIRKKGAVAIVKSEQVIDLIKAYLARYRDKQA